MGRKIDMVGQTFGSLTVLWQSDDSRKQVHWVCRCVCGNTVTVEGFVLRSGRKTSCGCNCKPKSKNSLVEIAKTAKAAGYPSYGKFVAQQYLASMK